MQRVPALHFGRNLDVSEFPESQFLWFWETDNGHLLENCNTRDRISRWLSPLLIVRVVVQIIILAVFWKAKGLFQKVSWVNNNAKKIHGKVVATRDWQKLWWMIIHHWKGFFGKNMPKKVPEVLAKTQSKLSKQKTAQNDQNWFESFVRVIFAPQQLVDEEAGWKVPATCCKSSKAMPSSRCLCFNAIVLQFYNSTSLQFYNFMIL